MFETLQLLIFQSNKVYGIEFKELLKVLNRAWLFLMPGFQIAIGVLSVIKKQNIFGKILFKVTV